MRRESRDRWLFLFSVPAAGKQPWLAASLSWLFPGMGQLYCGAYARAAGFGVLSGVVQVGRVVSLISDRLSTSTAVVLSISSWTLFSIYVSVDAFRTTRRLHVVDDQWKRVRGRNPYFAVFLTVILPGLGQIYMRRWITGVVFLVAYLALDPMSNGNVYSVIGLIAIEILAASHLLVTPPTQSVKSRWQIAWPAVGLIAISILANYGLSLATGYFLVAPGLAVGDSMAPTMVRRSYAVMDKLTYRYKEPAVGDIVMFTPPRESDVKAGLPACKRIVAIGGQTIQVRDGFVYIDGKYREPAPIHGPFPRSKDMASGDRSLYPYGVTEPYRVPGNHYFVMGDNRDDSLDSRAYGPVPRETIIARVARVYTLPFHRRQYDSRVRGKRGYKGG